MLLEKLNFLANKTFKGLIFFYQIVFSRFFGGHCRFYPSCSHYALEAFDQHSFLQALKLTFKRLFRCHPFGGKGFDPVPLKAKE